MPSIPKSTTPANLDDWSDDDDDQLQDNSAFESNVLLGIPNGAIDNETNERDAAVSRIGGLPALLPKKEPPFTSSHCKICNQPMELLIQIWCPFEDSPMDRALYVWGCSRAGCQGKEGGVRAFRGLRFNAPYAAKLEKKKARALAREEEKKKKRQQELEDAKRKEEEKKTASNPFSMGGNAGAQPFGSGFGLGAQLFGGTPAPVVAKAPTPVAPAENEESDDSDEDDQEGSDSDESLIVAMESTSVSESSWHKAPSYPPIYLDTVGEELPYERKTALPKGIKIDDGLDDIKGKDDSINWAKELYEDSLEVDKVFESFASRVKAEPNQCLRYDLNGIPLPFSSTDDVFAKLWPAPVEEPLPVTKPDFKVVRPQRRVYNKAAAGKCDKCGAERVFECQLMPNLINVVKQSDKDASTKLTDEARRKLVEQALKKNGTEKTGMTWGTVMVFSCSKDCLGEDGWSESSTIIQWDD